MSLGWLLSCLYRYSQFQRTRFLHYYNVTVKTHSSQIIQHRNVYHEVGSRSLNTPFLEDKVSVYKALIIFVTWRVLYCQSNLSVCGFQWMEAERVKLCWIILRVCLSGYYTSSVRFQILPDFATCVMFSIKLFAVHWTNGQVQFCITCCQHSTMEHCIN